MITKTRDMESMADIAEMEAIENAMEITEVFESPIDLKIADLEITADIGVFDLQPAEVAEPVSKPGFIARLAARVLALDSWLGGSSTTGQQRREQNLEKAQRDRMYPYI